MMNRKERRLYERSIKHDRRASKCPLCGHRSLFYTTGTLKLGIEEKEKYEKEDFDTKVCCEVCHGVVYEGEEVSKLVSPGIYLPLPIDVFGYAVRHPEVTEEQFFT